MGSNRNGFYGTLAALVLISAIPLFAIFGIPQFVPVVASPPPLDDALLTADPGELPVELPDAAAAGLLAPLPDTQRSLKSARGDGSISGDEAGRWDNPFEGPQVSLRAGAQTKGLEGWEVGTNDGPVEQLPLAAEALTWRTAVKRLNQHGIRQFRLQPGERENEFHFLCYFTPVDNPRITHLFEAEASEPLIAVQKVLDQITRWTRAR